MSRVPRPLEAAVRGLLYHAWAAGSRWGGRVSLGAPGRLTIIIRTFAPERARNLKPVVRILLRCDFVDRIFLLNNNPQNEPGDRLAFGDARVTLVNQDRQRGPGASWELAHREAGEYFLVLDDDLLLVPKQIATLFRGLLQRPEVPHGLAGYDGSRYLLSREGEVGTLSMAYAVTREQVRNYFECERLLIASGLVSAETIERWADDIVISRTGQSRPRVHRLGLVRLCPTYNAPLAQFKQAEFRARRAEVGNALRQIGWESPRIR